MTVPANILRQVQTYQMSGLALLQNLAAFIGTSNTKFKNFDKMTANLGDTVTFDLPPRFTTTNSLVATFQPANQRVQTLTVDGQISTSYAFTDQQFIFNVREYMDKFGKSAIAELGTAVESSVAQNCVTNTYRFYGDGSTPINSYNQLASALAFYRNYGAANGRAKGYISDVAVPAIVGTGLNQFAQERNNVIANSWELGLFSNCDWYSSNLLPVHVAGTVGNGGSAAGNNVLTVRSLIRDANNAITGIQFSGAVASDSQAILQFDKMQFKDNVSGQPNVRFLTFIGHKPSANPVQIQATTAGAADGSGYVTVSINPPLQALPTADQNLTTDIVAGMQVQIAPSHRAGLITAGDPMFLAMPQLPTETPYPTANMVDPETGVSIRQYYGSLFAQNMRGMVHDCIWGSTLVPEYGMALLFPL